MPQIYQFSEFEFLAFFLVLVRMTAFIVSWPVFGEALVPAPLKILLGLVMALVLFPTLSLEAMDMSSSLQSMNILFLFVKEAFIGLCIGYLGRLFFYTMSIAGEIISVSMGISSAQLFNPALGSNSSVTDQFLVTLATLFFLAIQGHHLFISALHQSFDILPLSNQFISFGAFENFGVVAQGIMVMGVKMSAPVLISILIMNLIMAIVGRAVPQINVLITSLPVNILVGFLILIVSLPLIMMQMNDFLELTAVQLFKILKGL